LFKSSETSLDYGDIGTDSCGGGGGRGDGAGSLGVATLYTICF